MEAILILSLPAFLMYKCAKNYVKDNFIYMKILDKDRYAICMIKPNFYQEVLETGEVIEKYVKIRFCFFQKLQQKPLALEPKYLLLNQTFLHAE